MRPALPLVCILLLTSACDRRGSDGARTAEDQAARNQAAARIDGTLGAGVPPPTTTAPPPPVR